MTESDFEGERRPIVTDDSTTGYHATSIRLSSKSKNESNLIMSWEHLTIIADVVSSSSTCFKRKEQVVLSKTLLYNLCGYALPGRILAIMGSSGAGKTTLLDALSGRRKETIGVSGSIHLNGQEVAPTILMNKCGYIEQNEMFIGSMTVREHLTFQAMLRMQQHTDDYRRERIMDVLEVLDLYQCQNTPIGIPGNDKGLSNGELRRLTFASVVLTNPSILLIDEPTSGLDSNLSKSIMNCIQRLADQGKTIITVLHQPSSQIFQMIDILCLLTHGYLAYFGPRQDAQDFFASMDRHCPSRYNPSEFYLEQLSAKDQEEQDKNFNDDSSVDLQRPPLDWNDAVEHYRQSKYHTDLIHQIEKTKNYKEVQLEPFDDTVDYQSSFFRQLKWLFWRSFRSSSKTLLQSKSLSFKLIIPAIILGIVYFQLRPSPEIIQNVNALTFMTLTTVTYSNAFVILAIFPREFQVFLREHRRRLYSTSAYYIAKIFSELPFFILVPWLFTTITYILAGFYRTFIVYILFCLSITLATIAANGFSGILAAAAPSTESAVAAVVPLLELFVLFAGFFLNNATIPFYLRWIRYITWYYYAYSLILIFIWHGITHIPCAETGFCLPTGDDILKYYDVHKEEAGFYLAMLLILIVAYNLITFAIIWFRARRR